MKAWYSKVRDTELKDGSVRATYVVTFETDNAELKREVEKYLQGIMDKDEPQTDGYMTAEQTEDYRKMLDKAEHKVYGNIEDEPQTDRLVQTNVIEFPDTHQKVVFEREITEEDDCIKVGKWKYKGFEEE